MNRILVVEDDDLISRVVKRGLEQSGYRVTVAADGESGLRLAKAGEFELLILDIMLPGIDGLQLCERLRAGRHATPILMLTAKGALDDKVQGLESGADDYLPKPFEFPELLARVRALLRRDKVHRARTIRVADLEIDTSTRRVTRSGTTITLSHREYDLLEALAASEGRILSREVIQERVWMDEESYSNTVDVYVGLLRKKVDAGHEVKLIQTVRGVGYTLRRPDESVDEAAD
jgi:DNA-binding response OmpR family regulator